MGLRINTNVTSLNARRHLINTSNEMAGSLERLATGSRINKAGDDAAGLAISENLKAQIRGLRQAKRNASDGISLVQTTEGGLNEVSAILIRLRELSIQASSDTVGDMERKFTNREFQSLKDEIQRFSDSTTFNGTKLLDGTAGRIDIQVGPYNTTNDRLSYESADAHASLEKLGLTELTVDSKEAARASIEKIDAGLHHVNEVRAGLGALQNRLNSTVNSLAIYDENLSAANSRVRDIDVAEESSHLVQKQILQQAGVSVLGHANTVMQQAIKLLG